MKFSVNFIHKIRFSVVLVQEITFGSVISALIYGIIAMGAVLLVSIVVIIIILVVMKKRKSKPDKTSNLEKCASVQSTASTR